MNRAGSPPNRLFAVRCRDPKVGSSWPEMSTKFGYPLGWLVAI